MSYQVPDLEDRRNSATAAKKALLEKFRAAAEDPGLAEKRAAKAVIHEARLVRMADREAAQRAREAELAVQAAREAEITAQKQQEAEELATLLAKEEAERAVALAAEQKAARDARYAARKAAKKQRRRGY